MVIPDIAEDAHERAGASLLGWCRHAADVGLAPAAAGNASVRVGDHVVMTASGARFRELSAADLVVVDLAGRVVHGEGRPTSELELHLATYAARADVGAIMHTHGRHAVALSSVASVVPALHYYCVELGGAVPVAPYRTYGTGELATVTTESLADRGGVVMAHHGSLTVGPDLATATARAELLEWLCELALLALAAGEPAELDAAALDDVRRQTASRRTS